MSYYLKTHMPLVMNKWGQYGLQKWDVIQYGPGADGAKSQYSVCAVLTWGKGEDMGKAGAGPEAAEIFGDIPNFSNKQPIILTGDMVGSS